jgi:DNA-binding transcriptional regulator GbsR (MarR family)
MSVFEKVRQFFDLKKKQQQRNIDKLKKMIAQLEAKSKGLKKHIEKETKQEKKEKLAREYKAVEKIIRKSRRHLAHLKAIKKSS